MFGNKKKHLKNDREHETKKKWQLEMEEEQDEVIPENLEIPKDTSEGDEQDLEKQQDAEEVDSLILVSLYHDRIKKMGIIMKLKIRMTNIKKSLNGCQVKMR